MCLNVTKLAEPAFYPTRIKMFASSYSIFNSYLQCTTFGFIICCSVYFFLKNFISDLSFARLCKLFFLPWEFFFFYFFVLFLIRRMITLQYSDGFCHTSAWISQCRHICLLLLKPPLTPPCYPSMLSQKHQLGLTMSKFPLAIYLREERKLSTIFSSLSTLPSPLKSVLYVYISFAMPLPIGSSVMIFLDSIYYLILIYNISIVA